MSYDIYLVDATGKTVEFEEPIDLRGGTYAVGGTREAWLNITYNYGPHFYKVLGRKGIRSLYGLTGLESMPMLDAAIATLGTDEDDDYWKATEGNARAALVNLRRLAELCPSGIWRGD